MRASLAWRHPLHAIQKVPNIKPYDVGQIGIVDVLREDYGVRPAGILGHSAGMWAQPPSKQQSSADHILLRKLYMSRHVRQTASCMRSICLTYRALPVRSR